MCVCRVFFIFYFLFPPANIVRKKNFNQQRSVDCTSTALTDSVMDDVQNELICNVSTEVSRYSADDPKNIPTEIRTEVWNGL